MDEIKERCTITPHCKGSMALSYHIRGDLYDVTCTQCGRSKTVTIEFEKPDVEKPEYPDTRYVTLEDASKIFGIPQDIVGRWIGKYYIRHALGDSGLMYRVGELRKAALQEGIRLPTVLRVSEPYSESSVLADGLPSNVIPLASVRPYRQAQRS